MILVIAGLISGAASAASEAIVSNLNGLKLFETAIHIGFAVYFVVCFFLALGKHRRFPTVAILGLSLSIAWQLFLLALYYLFYSDNLNWQGFSIVSVAVELLFTVALIGYLLRSERVNVTYRSRVRV